MLRDFCLLCIIACFADAAISITQSDCPLNTCVCSSNINITCTSLPYITRIAWSVDTTTVFECALTTCATYSSDYGFFHDTTSGTFTMSINPITIRDQQSVFRCNGEGAETASFQPDVVARLKPPDFNITTVVNNDKTHITVLTNCIDDPVSDVIFKLRDNASTTVKTENVISITSVACSNDDNPDCGGNNTARASVTFIISTQATGTQTGIKLISTQNGVGVDDVFIGNYILKAEDLDSSEDSSSWCKDNLNECVSMSVVASGVALLIIAIIVAVVKDKTYILRFEGIPSAFDIADILIKKYGFIIIKKNPSIDEPQPSLFRPCEMVNHTFEVSTKKLCLPKTIYVNQFKLSLNHEHECEPNENIYSFTDTTFQVRFEKIPVTLDIDEALKSEGFSVLCKDSEVEKQNSPILLCDTVNYCVCVLNTHTLVTTLPEVLTTDQFTLSLRSALKEQRIDCAYTITHADMVLKDFPMSVTNKTIISAFKAIDVKLTNVRNATDTTGLNKKLNCTTEDRIVTVSVKSLYEHSSKFFGIGPFMLKMEFQPGKKPFEYSLVIKEITVIVQDVPKTVTNAAIKLAFNKIKHNGIDEPDATNTVRNHGRPSSETIDRTVIVKEPDEPLPTLMPIDGFIFELQYVPSKKHFKCIYSLT